MGPFFILLLNPSIQIGLQFVKGLIHLLPKCHLVELLEDRLLESLTDAIGLGTVSLGPGVVEMGEGGTRSHRRKEAASAAAPYVAFPAEQRALEL